MAALRRVDLSNHDDGNNNSVDSNSFTENNRNEVLALDSGHLDGRADERSAGGVDSPGKVRKRLRLTRQSR